jgi:hypothetical protein
MSNGHIGGVNDVPDFTPTPGSSGVSPQAVQDMQARANDMRVHMLRLEASIADADAAVNALASWAQFALDAAEQIAGLVNRHIAARQQAEPAAQVSRETRIRQLLAGVGPILDQTDQGRLIRGVIERSLGV